MSQYATQGVYLGLDLGTSGLKAVALSPSGAVLARAAAAYPTRRPAAGACEQDPADWQRAVEQVTAQLAEVIPPRRRAGGWDRPRWPGPGPRQRY